MDVMTFSNTSRSIDCQHLSWLATYCRMACTSMDMGYFLHSMPVKTARLVNQSAVEMPSSLILPVLRASSSTSTKVSTSKASGEKNLTASISGSIMLG